ncbi:MAG: formyltransferase family protein, partial [Planctomycetota bacterium]
MPLSCIIVGDNSTHLECAKILLGAKMRIEGIFTEHSDTIAWGKDNNVSVREKSQLANAIQLRQPDYIFSIANFDILPSPVLELARKAAINFHDGPLPRYAGTNAPTWAILNGEQEHGVSWHLMTTDIDAGDILMQSRFPISRQDTAYTLSLKCLEHAKTTFQTLVNRLISDGIQAIPQNRLLRTFYSRDQPLPMGGLIDFRLPASQICNLVRAVDFGPMPNLVGMAKIAIDSERFIMPRRVRHRPDSCDQPPGSVDFDHSDGWRVATGELWVEFFDCIDTNGNPVSKAELEGKYGIATGSVLPQAATSPLATELAGDHRKHRRFLSQELRDFQKTGDLFDDTGLSIHKAHVDDASHEFVSLEIEPPSEQDNATYRPFEIVLARFATLLARLTASNSINIGFRQHVPNPLLSATKPLRLSIDWTKPFVQVVQHVIDQIAIIERHGFMEVDLPFALLGEEYASRWSGLIVCCNSKSAEIGWEFNAQLRFRVDPQDGRSWMESRCETFRSSDIESLRSAYLELADLLSLDDHISLAQKFLRSAVPLQSRLDLVQCDENDLFVHERIFAQCRRTPKAIAVAVGGVSISYEELAHRAKAVAGFLREKGVRSGDAVGVAIGRNENLVPVLQGILAVGACYVPLDLTYPAVR